MTDDRQSPEEMAAQVADGSAAATLEAWIMGVRELRQWPIWPLGLEQRQDAFHARCAPGDQLSPLRLIEGQC